MQTVMLVLVEFVVFAMYMKQGTVALWWSFLGYPYGYADISLAYGAKISLNILHFFLWAGVPMFNSWVQTGIIDLQLMSWSISETNLQIEK